MKNLPLYDSTPVIGYGEGMIFTATAYPYRKDNNDWFDIDGRRYNVHPYRADLGGYPVRWNEEI